MENNKGKGLREQIKENIPYNVDKVDWIKFEDFLKDLAEVTKTSKLDDWQWERIKQHPEFDNAVKEVWEKRKADYEERQNKDQGL